jgi:hypothetical protein
VPENILALCAQKEIDIAKPFPQADAIHGGMPGEKVRR